MVWRGLHARLFKCQLLFLLGGRKGKKGGGRKEEGESDVMEEKRRARRARPRAEHMHYCHSLPKPHQGHGKGTRKPRGCGEDNRHRLRGWKAVHEDSRFTGAENRGDS